MGCVRHMCQAFTGAFTSPGDTRNPFRAGALRVCNGVCQRMSDYVVGRRQGQGQLQKRFRFHCYGLGRPTDGPAPGHAVNRPPVPGPTASGCAFSRTRGSASQAVRLHPWGLGENIHVFDSPYGGHPPASPDSWLRGVGESSQAGPGSTAFHGRRHTVEGSAGVGLRDRKKHGPGACAGRVGQDAQPRPCRVRRMAYTSKFSTSLHG